MTEVKVSWLRDYYKLLDNFHVNVPRPEDPITSSSLDCLAMYNEFFLVSLRFPLYPFIVNMLDLF